MKKKYVLVMFLAIFIFSCKSIPQKDDCIVYLMVYDYGNNALQNVVVMIDEEVVGKTDVYGRFVMQINSDKEEHKITIRKEGYESVVVTEEMENQKVFYFKVGNSSYYAELAEKYFDQKEYEKAENAIEIALSIEDRRDYLFLQKVIQEGKR